MPSKGGTTTSNWDSIGGWTGFKGPCSVKLPRLDRWNARRREIAARYPRAEGRRGAFSTAL